MFRNRSRRGVTRAQKGVLALSGLALAGAIILAPTATLLLAPLLLGVIFLAAAFLQIGVTLAAAPQKSPPVERRDDRLPRYSVLVPLYREASVVSDLVAALAAIDYPKERLQILLVTEAHDEGTQAAINALALPDNIAMLVAPAGTPHTKPRAINAALPFANGTFLVVYDAEDRPDPLQLRAAVAAFDAAGPNVACLQARLAIDNIEDSWLTRMFAIEYAALFDVVKAGTAKLGLPVPLGGTSNHFRADALRAVGLWDAWNVTEDADLGFRLALHGLAVRDLNSTTDEEAPHTTRAWLNQRTRWLKGWMQTVLTHSRQPIRTWRALGTAGFFAAVAQSACVIAGALGTPLFQALVLIRLLAPEPLLSGPVANRIADGVMVLLGLTGLICTLLPALIGMARRGLWHLLPWLPLMLVYQFLVSIAAYRAFHELVIAPFRWNKTQHGTARSRKRRQR
ncbi:MAG: glycosyltransferase [Proteobacteria bacterium]|nr:glycosyltransferase [Pseudomonadota bacterium]